MKRILFIAILFFGFSANAGVYVDPYLSYVMSGSYERGTTDEDVSGMFLGARIGYGMLGLAFGVEYMISDGEVDMAGTNDLSHGSLGVFAAYELPILLRVYGTYFFDDSVEYDSGTSTSDFTGTGLKLGVGYTGLPFVSINFEHYVATYDEADGNALTNDVDYTVTMIGVSIPLSL